MRIGVGFTPFETRTDVILRLAAQADESGSSASTSPRAGRTTRCSARRARAADHADRARALGRLGLGAHAGDHRARRGRSAAPVRRALLARDRRGQPAADRGLPRHPVGPARRAAARDGGGRARAAGGRAAPDPAPGARPLRLGVLPDVPVPIALAALSPARSGSPASSPTLDAVPVGALAAARGARAAGGGRGAAAAPLPTRVCVGVPVALGPDEAGARALPPGGCRPT